MPEDTRWGRRLAVAADGDGLIGHAGAALLRKLADQCGLKSALGAALTRAGKLSLIDCGVALASMAVAIVLGATSMSDIALLDHHGLARRCPAWRWRETGLRLLRGTWEGRRRYGARCPAEGGGGERERTAAAETARC